MVEQPEEPSAPVEVLGSHDHRAHGSARRNQVLVAILVTAALLGWLALRPTPAKPAAAGSTPAPTSRSSVAAVPSTGPASGPGLTIGTRYLRTDGVQHRAFLEITLAPTTSTSLQLTRIRISGSPVPMQAQFLDPVHAQNALLASLPHVFQAISPHGATTPATAQPNAPAVLALYLEPDCSQAPYSDYPSVSVDFRVPGETRTRTYELPSGMLIVTAWFDDAIAEACNGIPHRAQIVQTRMLNGLVLTTTGPSSPNGVQPFAVTLRVTNRSTKPFSGQLGVLLFDRSRTGANGNIAGLGGLSLVQLTSQPNVTGWTVYGSSSGSIAAVGVGAARTGQHLAAGASVTLTFLFQMGNPGSLLGPATGWVPMIEPAGRSVPSYPDPTTFPQITRPAPG